VKAYLYQLLARYIGLFARGDDRIVNLDPVTVDLEAALPNMQPASLADAETLLSQADVVVLNGNLHYERDIQDYLEQLHASVGASCRVVVIYYSALWRPMLSLANLLGWRRKTPELNWLAPSDVQNLLRLTNFESIRVEQKVLIPIYIPLISGFVNRFIAPLPGFNLLCLANVLVARPLQKPPLARPSVSIIVPARNEAGNIEAIVQRVPALGPDDELVFVEGGSTDDTWERIQDVIARYGASRRIIAARQDGRGKGDAVRKGFALARNEVLMILDADITVPPEDLPKFYRALVEGKGEFINGSRLVYPMERRAMRFLNLVGNKFFAAAFSFVLAQPLKDTLCGTKVITRRNYERLAANRSYFGEFDPFGDFDLLFGSARMGLKIVEVPILYRERTYGQTNISRWSHGALLIAMLVFGARRLKFV
jgi:hypothetical protein